MEKNTLRLLRKAERTDLELQSLYEQYGYEKYRMNRFEQYEFYIENKNFLGYDRYITYTDRTGRLMALKPDVTLSIAKNAKGNEVSGRVYYSENIYRPVKNSGEFREMSQTGLEFIGALDDVKTMEVITLAIKSLEIISASYVLSLSHMGMIDGLMDSVDAKYEVKEQLLYCIKTKNAHDSDRICDENGIGADTKKRISDLIAISGKLSDAVKMLPALCCNDKMTAAARELEMIGKSVAKAGYDEKVMLDFDSVSNTQYYNGVMLTGYIESVAGAVLVGGRYDNLLKKMGKSGLNAMGFAVNFFELDRFLKDDKAPVINTVVLYDDNTDPGAVQKTVSELASTGERVITERSIPENLQYDNVVDLRESEAGRNA